MNSQNLLLRYFKAESYTYKNLKPAHLTALCKILDVLPNSSKIIEGLLVNYSHRQNLLQAMNDLSLYATKELSTIDRSQS